MDLETLLMPLALEELSDKWVQDIWDREFMDDIPLPSNFNLDYNCSNYVLDIIKYLHTLLSNTDDDASEDESTASESWKSLVTVIKHDKLIALLFSLINRGECILSEEYRMCSLYSAQLYIVMLSIPGSNAYKVFHCQMFVVCLKAFKLGESLLDNEEEYNDSNICSGVNDINRILNFALQDLHLLIGRFNLKTNSVCLEENVSILVDLTDNVQMNCRLNIG